MDNLDIVKEQLQEMVDNYGLENLVILLSTIAEEHGWESDFAQLDLLDLEH